MRMGWGQRSPRPSSSHPAGRRRQRFVSPALRGGARKAPQNRSPYQGTDSELLCHVITSLRQLIRSPQSMTNAKQDHSNGAEGHQSTKGSEVGAGLSSPPATLVKNYFDSYDLPPGPPFTFPLSPTNLIKVFLSSCGCNSDPKPWRHSQTDELIEEPTSHVPRGKQISLHVIQVVQGQSRIF